MYLGVSRNWPSKIDPKAVPESETNSLCFGDFETTFYSSNFETDPSLCQSLGWLLCTVSRHYHGFKRVRHGVNSRILKSLFFFLFNNVGVSKNRGTRVGMATKGNHLPV